MTATARLRVRIGRPCQEVADSVAALRVGLGQPAIEIVLAQLLERDCLLVDPGEQLKGDQDPATQLTPRGGRVTARGGAMACSPQQKPMQKRTDEVGVRGRFVGEVVIEPRRNTVEVLVAARQYAGLHHDLADGVDAGGGRQVIEQVVTQRPTVGDDLRQQCRVRAGADPSDRGERQPDVSEGLDEWLQLGADGAVPAGQ
jgi:hypothetical protein